jgi:phosphoesterase RecJ-like protein
MAITEQEWGRATEALVQAGEVALGGHIDPDGDALGSMLALGKALERLGVGMCVGWGLDASADEPLAVPPAYTFLPGIDAVVPPAGFPEAPDVFVALDCATPERLGALRPIARNAGVVIVVDHHAQGQAFGDVRLVDPDAPATAVLVTELIDRLGIPIDTDLATCLYTGLVTDTGRFSYANASPGTLRLGARLMETGIDHAAINRQVWDTHSLAYLRLLARVLERATLLGEHSLVYAVVTRADLEATGVTLAETEGIIDVVRSVEDAECALVLKESAQGSWNVSLRSKVLLDVGAVAEALGGGGHRYAAGFTADGEAAEVVARVVEALHALPGPVGES